MLPIDGPVSSGMPIAEFFKMFISPLLLGSWIVAMFLIILLMVIDIFNWLRDRQTPV